MRQLIVQELVREINNYRHQGFVYEQPNRILPSVYLAGTECVGKSTLFNLLLGSNKAQVSDVPLDVSILVEGIWANVLRFIDGVTYKGKYKDFGFSIRDARSFVQVCDIKSIRRLDFELAKQLEESKIPFVVVLNKADRVLSRDKRLIIKARFEQQLGKSVLLISALTGENVDELVYSIAQLLKGDEQIEFVETLAQQGQVLKRENTDKQRRESCDRIIQEYVRQVAKTSTGEATDLAEIVFLHGDMIREIAEVYNIETPPEVVESRTQHIIHSAIHTLSQNIPLVGDKVSVVSAIVWTSSIGNTAIELFENQITETYIDKTLEYYSGRQK